MPLSNYALLTAAPGSGTRYNSSRPGAFQWDIVKRAYVVPQTGVPYTGSLGTPGNYSINGQHSTTPPPGATDPNAAPGSDITVSHTPLQPALAALTESLTGNAANQFTKTNADLAAAIPGWQDIATRSYTQSQNALDTGKIESQLTGSLAAQEKAQRDLVAQQGQRNQDYTTSTNANLARLSEINAESAANMRAAGERAGAVAITSTNAIPLMRGQNPEVRSGAQPSRVAVALANALRPWQQAITDQKYATVANFQQPWQRELYAQDIALNQFQSVLEGALGTNHRANFQFIDNLARQASTMRREDQERYIAQQLMIAGVPMEFLSRQTSLAQALSNLRQRTFEDLPSQPVDTGQFVGGPSFNASDLGGGYRPGTPNPNVMPRGNAQDGTGPNARGWQDWNQLWNTPAQASRAAQDYIYTPEGLQDYYDAYGTYPPARQYTSGGVVAGIPSGPTSGGWGSVNGEYIGADADWYNEAVYGPAVSPYE